MGDGNEPVSHAVQHVHVIWKKDFDMETYSVSNTNWDTSRRCRDTALSWNFCLFRFKIVYVMTETLKKIFTWYERLVSVIFEL